MPAVFHSLALTLRLQVSEDDAPYVLVKQLTNMFDIMTCQDWIDWIFLCMLENEGEAHEDDKQEAKVGFQTIALQLVLYLPLLYLLPSYADVIINTIVMMNLIANNPSFRSMVVRKNNPTLHR